MWQPEIQTPSTNALQQALWLCHRCHRFLHNPQMLTWPSHLTKKVPPISQTDLRALRAPFIGLWGDKNLSVYSYCTLSYIHVCTHSLLTSTGVFFFFRQYFTTAFGSWAGFQKNYKSQTTCTFLFSSAALVQSSPSVRLIRSAWLQKLIHGISHRKLWLMLTTVARMSSGSYESNADNAEFI